MLQLKATVYDGSASEKFDVHLLASCATIAPDGCQLQVDLFFYGCMYLYVQKDKKMKFHG